MIQQMQFAEAFQKQTDKKNTVTATQQRWWIGKLKLTPTLAPEVRA
jgi:hypothetical protein